MAMREINIEIKGETGETIVCEDAGMAGEHNAACLVFTLPAALRNQDLKFYAEYQSRTGRTVRSRYLEKDASGKVIFPITAELSSQIRAECTFNAVAFEEGKLVQKIKPVKLLLKFTPSPDCAVIYEESASVNFEELLEFLRNAGTGIFRYERQVDASDWTFQSGIFKTVVPENEHKLGTGASLVLSEAFDGERYKPVTCTYYRDEGGNVTVLSHVPFKGRLILSLSEQKLI
ncbi:MAG TPA: hypothetical protein PLU77_01800 [Clostridiales bacterium]|nr:hypothetical protein [Clostridiales bacterium]